MIVVSTPVEVSIERLYCDTCGGEMKFLGLTFPSSSSRTQYSHECDMGHTQIIKGIVYPNTIYTDKIDMSFLG